MKKLNHWIVVGLGALAMGIVLSNVGDVEAQDAKSADGKAKPGETKAKPALTVTTTQATRADWPIRLSANGNIAAWQEAVVGAEATGLRILDVRANVGDWVKKGQVLATFAGETIQADFNTQSAGIAEAKVALAYAQAEAARARSLQESGAIAASQIAQLANAEKAAEARLSALQVAQQSTQVRLAQTRVVAPDDGIVASRTATVGAVVSLGQTEMFRLIRKGRLEWRAEVTASELAKISPKQTVVVTLPTQATVNGTVRLIGPTVDPTTRNALVYVDLAPNAAARVGMYATGEFSVGATTALTIPQSALVTRDGFSYVMKLGANSVVSQKKVTTGRRNAGRVEVLDGVAANDVLVATGAAFLAEGDMVRVVNSAPAATQTAPAK